MRKIAHLSDLHFGTEDINITNDLAEDLITMDPDLLIISGDLTQRGRTSQYKSAKEFLSRLPFKKIIVPGNHDIPLFDLFSRFFFPLTRYKKLITNDLNPFYEDDEIAVLGINTARSLTWKEGRISYEQMKLIESKMCRISGSKFKILVTHHPFIPPPGNPGITLVGRSIKALVIIDRCEIDLLIAGHLHLGYSGDVRSYYPARNRSLISVHAGTGISRRRREQNNAYNFITVQNNKIEIDIRIWNKNTFIPELKTTYDLKGDEWIRKI